VAHNSLANTGVGPNVKLADRIFSNTFLTFGQLPDIFLMDVIQWHFQVFQTKLITNLVCHIQCIIISKQSYICLLLTIRPAEHNGHATTHTAYQHLQR